MCCEYFWQDNHLWPFLSLQSARQTISCDLCSSHVDVWRNQTPDWVSVCVFSSLNVHLKINLIHPQCGRQLFLYLCKSEVLTMKVKIVHGEADRKQLWNLKIKAFLIKIPASLSSMSFSPKHWGICPLYSWSWTIQQTRLVIKENPNFVAIASISLLNSKLASSSLGTFWENFMIFSYQIMFHINS